jgi:NTP pyrophosphatase (non-canonical NTP hydrolase)
MVTRIGNQLYYQNFKVGAAKHPNDDQSMYLVFTDTDNEEVHMFEMALDRLQRQRKPWGEHNFPDATPEDQIIGAIEELGELAHANLKRRQGIRGTEAEHTDAERDAIGDIIIYLTGYCINRGFSIAECVERAWNEVKDRDWIANKDNGSA